MLGFWQWLFVHNNWVGALIMYGALFLWGCVISLGDSSKHKVCSFILAAVIGTLFSFLTTYQDGYRSYKNHWTTCNKPEAVAASYIFDEAKERCFKPVTGLITVDARNFKTLNEDK